MLVHTVFFYLKVDISEEETADFVKQVETLGTIETVRSSYVGTPAATPPRPVVRSDYSVSATVVFDDVEGHNVYQDHPVHHEFIAKNKHLWTDVVIYDAD